MGANRTRCPLRRSDDPLSRRLGRRNHARRNLRPHPADPDIPDVGRNPWQDSSDTASLAAFIFSRDKAAIDRFIGELSFSGGAVNQVNIHLFIETMPFGGVGPSGMGHYYGKYGFDMLTHAKSMLISPPDAAIKHLFPSFSPEKNADLKIWSEY
jgi:hypothetical protein